MSIFEIFASAGLVGLVIAVAHILLKRPTVGNSVVAAALSLGFAVYSLRTIFEEGIVLVWTNHTNNFWGAQVWLDLCFAMGIGLFLIAPRARAVGMNLPLWALFVVSTASIGLLAMCARLFWLENTAQASETDSTTAKPSTI